MARYRKSHEVTSWNRGFHNHLRGRVGDGLPDIVIERAGVNGGRGEDQVDGIEAQGEDRSREGKSVRRQSKQIQTPGQDKVRLVMQDFGAPSKSVMEPEKC